MYIGKTPTVGNFQVCDAISVVNGQAAYTLQVGGVNVAPESANHMLVSLNGILQKPGSSFTISGSTMTFASNLATGDSIDFVQILGNVLDIGQPSDDTVTAAKLNNDVISGQTALTSAPDDTDELLISDAGTIKRIDVSLVGGKNTPAFEAHLGSDTSQLSNDTDTKLQFNTEIFDTDGTYDNSSNYRFTPGVAGKYFIYGRVIFNDTNVGTSDEHIVKIYKNGSQASVFFTHSGTRNDPIITYHETFDLNSSDYIEIYAKINNSDGGRVIHGNVANQKFTTFGAYKLIT